jgi:UDP-N-acetylmuramoyl-L-alanyl-D-glutamate--2,6-diaminopimelate ligase
MLQATKNCKLQSSNGNRKMMLINENDIVLELQRHLFQRAEKQASPQAVLSCSLRVTQNSRDVAREDVFVALKGHDLDGARFISNAIENGASAILFDTLCDQSYLDEPGVQSAIQQNSICVIQVDNLRQKLPAICRWFYLGDSSHLPVIGITGTNGKTSISHLLAQLAEHNISNQISPATTESTSVNSCAVIGTMGTGHFNDLQPAKNTTPGITDVYYLLKQFANDPKHSFSHVAMEVSSHALAQGRVDGLAFETAVFTNLTHEHLDYHGTMEQYFAEKAKLFTQYQPHNVVVNVDDEYGLKLTNLIGPQTRLVVYGQTEQVKSYDNFVHIAQVDCHSHGLRLVFDWQIDGAKETTELNLPLFGEFNAENVAAVFATAKLSGWALESQAYAELKPVPGRLELCVAPEVPIGIVDYAHTPDALKASLAAVRRHLRGKLFLVFGCGGDRDKGKRPLMAEVAEKFADHIIVTNDNPRTESQQHIVDDIMQGFRFTNNIEIEMDRKQAIQHAFDLASPKDAILIAGKGHENYQIIGDQTIDYDERAFVAGLVKQLQERT